MLLLCCVHIIIIITQVHPDVSDAEDAHDVFIELSMIYNVLR
jgi:DnaJ-class molecular chaperone